MAICSGRKADGTRCQAQAIRDSAYCIGHDPNQAEARKRRASKGGRRGGRGRPLTDVHDIKERLLNLADDALEGNVDPRVAAVVGQLLNTVLRAVSVELQVREQIELEERVQELEEALRRQEERGAHRGYS